MSRLPERLETERLRLILITAADAADMRAGRRQERWHPSYPRRDDVDAATLVRDGDKDASWGPRHVVLGHQAVGSIGCFAPPEDGETEVGFGLVPEVRGQGMATEALQALVAAAGGVGVRLRASVSPDNPASLRVLARCGFTELRGSNEDGELVLALPARMTGGGGGVTLESPPERGNHDLAGQIWATRSWLPRSSGETNDHPRAPR